MQGSPDYKLDRQREAALRGLEHLTSLLPGSSKHVLPNEGISLRPGIRR